MSKKRLSVLEMGNIAHKGGVAYVKRTNRINRCAIFVSIAIELFAWWVVNKQDDDLTSCF